jgi:hypothetical protein
VNDKALTRILLIEAHSLIASKARRAVSRIGVSLRKKPERFNPTALDFVKPGLARELADAIYQITLTYPPEKRPLSPAEERALRAFKLTRIERDALRKLVAEACAATMFDFLCVMDAAGDPDAVRTRRWRGASFAARKPGPLLHDEFEDLYWEYKRSKARAKASEGKKRRQKRGLSKRAR